MRVLDSCCDIKSPIVGAHPKYGPLRKCQKCKGYWVAQSNRFWEEVLKGDESPNGYSRVFYGPGELGLANSILCGCSIKQAILDIAEGPRKC